MSDPAPRWLVVVKRDQRDLYDRLSALFGNDPRVEIILDRRAVESPEETARWHDRRKPLSPQQTEAWTDLGFFMARRQDTPPADDRQEGSFFTK